MEGRHPGSTHTNTHTDQRAAVFSGDAECAAGPEHVLGRQRDSWWGSGDGGGEVRGIAQGDITLVWPVSRPPVLEHEKKQVVYTPVKKSHHIPSSTWMLFRLMDSGLTQ